MPYVKRRATAFLILMIIGIFVLSVAFILMITRPARASVETEGLPPGITCELIREKVAEYGRAVAWAWALRQGYSFAQIRVAKRCLK